MGMICGLACASRVEIEKLLTDPETVVDFIENGSHLQLDLDKAWHGIHFLLTGSADGGEEPLCYLLAGGQEIGDVDVGYGPARTLGPEEVAAFSGALAAISKAELTQRFSPQAMTDAEIYPDIWDRAAGEDDALGYLLEYYDQLKDFVATAYRNGSGLVVWLG